MDYLGRNYRAALKMEDLDCSNDQYESMEVTLAQLKLINVPSMFDVGCC